MNNPQHQSISKLTEIFLNWFNHLRDNSNPQVFKMLVHKAVRYAGLRGDWFIVSSEERIQMDPERTIAHNAFIDACNIVSRDMAKLNLDISWGQELGQDRKAIGDFACAVHYFIGLEAS